jgi:hypothetical protein
MSQHFGKRFPGQADCATFYGAAGILLSKPET